MSAIEDIQSLRRLIEWYDNRYRALSEEAKRRVDGGPFCRVPIGGGEEILEVFILGGKPNRRAVRHAIRWLEAFLEDLPLEDVPAPTSGQPVSASLLGGGSNEPGNPVDGAGYSVQKEHLMNCQRPNCKHDEPVLARYLILIEGQRLPVCTLCSVEAKHEGFGVIPMFEYVRVTPCPNCEHDTEHEDEVCYCEVAGCDCDRTAVDGFCREVQIA